MNKKIGIINVFFLSIVTCGLHSLSWRTKPREATFGESVEALKTMGQEQCVFDDKSVESIRFHVSNIRDGVNVKAKIIAGYISRIDGVLDKEDRSSLLYFGKKELVRYVRLFEEFSSECDLLLKELKKRDRDIEKIQRKLEFINEQSLSVATEYSCSVCVVKSIKEELAK